MSDPAFDFSFLATSKCPGTYDVPFQATVLRDASFGKLLDGYCALQNIAMQEEYQTYSPEELRLQDYYIKGKLGKESSGETSDVEEPMQERRLQLFNPKRDILKLEVDFNRRMKEIVDGATGKLSGSLIIQSQGLVNLQHELEELKNKNEREKEEAVAEVEVRLREQFEAEKNEEIEKAEEKLMETLESRSKEMIKALEKRLTEGQEMFEAELNAQLTKSRHLILEDALDNMTDDQILNLFNSKPHIAATLKKVTAGDREMMTTGLLEQEIQFLLLSNPTAKTILAGNVKRHLDIEVQKVKEEHEKDLRQKLEEARVKAELLQARAVHMEQKKSTSKLRTAEANFRCVTAKWEVVEDAAKTTPFENVGAVYKIAKQASTPPAGTSDSLNTRIDSGGPGRQVLSLSSPPSRGHQKPDGAVKVPNRQGIINRSPGAAHNNSSLAIGSGLGQLNKSSPFNPPTGPRLISSSRIYPTFGAPRTAFTEPKRERSADDVGRDVEATKKMRGNGLSGGFP